METNMETIKSEIIKLTEDNNDIYNFFKYDKEVKFNIDNVPNQVNDILNKYSLTSNQSSLILYEINEDFKINQLTSRYFYQED